MTSLDSTRKVSVSEISSLASQFGLSSASFKVAGANFNIGELLSGASSIEAISSGIDSNLTKMLETNSWGGIVVNDKLQTSIEKVFAGGDCVSGPSLVVLAMKDGIKAANSIDEFLKG